MLLAIEMVHIRSVRNFVQLAINLDRLTTLEEHRATHSLLVDFGFATRNFHCLHHSEHVVQHGLPLLPNIFVSIVKLVNVVVFSARFHKLGN